MDAQTAQPSISVTRRIREFKYGHIWMPEKNRGPENHLAAS
jgi:hypothetical protein